MISRAPTDILCAADSISNSLGVGDEVGGFRRMQRGGYKWSAKVRD